MATIYYVGERILDLPPPLTVHHWAACRCFHTKVVFITTLGIRVVCWSTPSSKWVSQNSAFRISQVEARWTLV